VSLFVDSREFDSAYALVRAWRKRARAVRSQFLYRSVDCVYKDVLKNIPSDRDELRKSLRVQRIQGLSDAVDGYCIRAIPSRTVVKREDAEDVVVYVSAKNNLLYKVPEATLILQEFSPWTLDTLPYPPDAKTSDVISRKVSRREVVKVRKLRRRDRSVWRRRIVAAGLRMRDKGALVGKDRPEAVSDVAFESMRLEFGLGDSPAKSHWRKGILRLAKGGGIGMISRRREFVRSMTDLSFSAWKRWPVRVGDVVSVSVAKHLVSFQDRLGLRLGR